MAWSVGKGVDELISRLQANDPSLTSLHVFQGKQFGDEEAVHLAKALPSNEHLTELYASGHELRAETVRTLARAIAKNQTLRTLCIGNSSFGDSSTAALAEGIAGSKSLQQLDLENKAVGPLGAAALGKALGSGLQLKVLLLARNPLTNAGIAELAEGIGKSQLTLLDLRDCMITAEGAASLADAMAACATLQVVRLDENNLGPEGAHTLAKALDTSSLREMHLSHTSIGDHGLAEIAEASTSSKLEVLEVNGCGIGPEGARLLTSALSSAPFLRVLRMRDNSIEDEGAEHLGAALAGGSRLEELDVSNNQLGEGAARILQGSSQLKKLSLHNAQLSNNGAIALSNLLAASVFTNLQELELSGCEIGRPGMSRLFEVLQGFAAPALEILLLAGNPGVNDSDFAMHVDVLSTTRTDLDVVTNGSCEALPTAADGGPPQPAHTQNWSVSHNGDDNC